MYHHTYVQPFFMYHHTLINCIPALFTKYPSLTMLFADGQAEWEQTAKGTGRRLRNSVFGRYMCSD